MRNEPHSYRPQKGNIRLDGVLNCVTAQAGMFQWVVRTIPLDPQFNDFYPQAQLLSAARNIEYGLLQRLHRNQIAQGTRFSCTNSQCREVTRWRYWGPKSVADYTASQIQKWSHRPEPVDIFPIGLYYSSVESSSSSLFSF
ncbi:uncharacterized protein LOC144367356 [Ictidomys tridecemlineatus]